MQFGIFDHMERRHDVGQTQQFEERLQLLEQADRAGFYCYHVAEHHHSPLNLAPNQAVYLAAVAQRTKNIRLSTLVYVLPLHNPIRLIEEVCMIDQLSNGRFEVGVGRGTDRAQELRMWGGEEDENDGRFEESLEILLKGLTTDFLSYEGRFFNIKDLWMELRPAQQPHPGFWWPGNPVHAGEHGMNFIGAERTGMQGIRDAMDQYLAAYAASPTKQLCGRKEPLYGAVKHVYIADSDAEAEERTRTTYEEFRCHYIKPLPGGRIDEEEIPRPAHIMVDTAMNNGGLIYGSPETVRNYLKEYVAESNANYFVSSFHWGDLTHKEASRSMELFASDVMPAFTSAPVA